MCFQGSSKLLLSVRYSIFNLVIDELLDENHFSLVDNAQFGAFAVFQFDVMYHCNCFIILVVTILILTEYDMCDSDM